MKISQGQNVGANNGDTHKSKLTLNQATCLESVRPIFVATANSRNDSVTFQDCEDIWGLIVEYTSENGLNWLCSPMELILIETSNLDLGKALLRSRLLSRRVMNRKVIDYLRKYRAQKRDVRMTSSHDELDEDGNPLIQIFYEIDAFQAMEAGEELALILAEVGQTLSGTNREILNSFVTNPFSGVHSSEVAWNLTGYDDPKIRKRIAARTGETCRAVRRHFANNSGKTRPIFAGPVTTLVRARRSQS